MDKLQYLDEWLEDGWVDNLISETELAHSNRLGVSAYHIAKNTPDEVCQYFEVRYKGKAYRLDFASDIKPKIQALIEAELQA